ncbi:phage holin family protein [Desulfosporosinus sp. BICA1-9]|uniref:phage holin family protein n=1 Tax=Desulfosporosinus sp. BICA1-9 TaxID=1531958 RepID=UPI00054B32E0|nr:phage holin family protein [Desulfosporosinus sp. BICA1-9]KJS47956.1 MAG: membrane protein [Peptococcaceae bacterium BRH_c23]KJS88781.1 MAG: membrane protein [Desulfosporosinus sp. BICA1-9]HBW34049.1 phage holin family protein [Desulfosporosinus sp.]
MKRLIYRFLINTLAFFIAAQFLPIVATTPVHIFWAGIILGLVNLMIRPVLIILTIPLNLITLGVFTFVINTWMIMLTSGLVPGFHVPGFGVALLASIVVSLANWGFKEIKF